MQDTKVSNYKILVFLTETRKAYVFTTASSDLQRVYRSHQAGSNPSTSAMFELETLPRLFLLQNIKTTSAKAFGHRVAWSAYFREHGYALTDQSLREHMTHLHPNDKLILDALREQPLSQVLSSSAEIIIKFHPTDDSKHKLCFSLSQTEYNQLKLEAAGVNMTTQEYSKAKFLGQKILRPDIWELHQCKKSINNATNIANNIAAQGLIDGVNEDQILELKYAITDLRKETHALSKAIESLLTEGRK